jgi:hypothetical protein
LERVYGSEWSMAVFRAVLPLSSLPLSLYLHTLSLSPSIVCLEVYTNHRLRRFHLGDLKGLLIRIPLWQASLLKVYKITLPPSNSLVLFLSLFVFWGGGEGNREVPQ